MHRQKGSLRHVMKHWFLFYSFLLCLMKGGVPSSTTRLRPNFRLRITCVPMPPDKYSTQHILRISEFSALSRLASRRSVSRHSDQVHHDLKCPCRLRGGARIGHSKRPATATTGTTGTAGRSQATPARRAASAAVAGRPALSVRAGRGGMGVT